MQTGCARFTLTTARRPSKIPRSLTWSSAPDTVIRVHQKRKLAVRPDFSRSLYLRRARQGTAENNCAIPVSISSKTAVQALSPTNTRILARGHSCCLCSPSYTFHWSDAKAHLILIFLLTKITASRISSQKRPVGSSEFDKKTKQIKNPRVWSNCSEETEVSNPHKNDEPPDRIDMKWTTRASPNDKTVRSKRIIHRLYWYRRTHSYCAHTIALAALAILGHKSAHSFPMGPVIADPAKDIRTWNN